MNFACHPERREGPDSTSINSFPSNKEPQLSALNSNEIVEKEKTLPCHPERSEGPDSRSINSFPSNKELQLLALTG
jgi:hypothetical protein